MSLDQLEKQVNEMLGILPKRSSTKPPRAAMHKWLRFNFDNPVLGPILKFNPVSWILETLGEDAEGMKI